MHIAYYLRPLISGAMLGLLLAYPQPAMEAALQALHIFVQSVLPALLPFTACMLLFTAGRKTTLPPLLLLAYLGGSPAGARLFQDAPLSRAQARRTAAMTGTMSPMFFLGTLSLWLKNPVAGRILLGCHLLSALACGLLFRQEKNMRRKRIELPPLSISGALSQAALSMLTVGACIVLGTVGARMVSCLLPNLPAFPLSLLQSLLEVTSGCKSLTALPLPSRTLLPLVCAACSFGGLSILLQNAAFWGKHHISLFSLLGYGFLRAVAAFLLCRMILFCLPAGFAL